MLLSPGSAPNGMRLRVRPTEVGLLGRHRRQEDRRRCDLGKLTIDRIRGEYPRIGGRVGVEPGRDNDFQGATERRGALDGKLTGGGGGGKLIGEYTAAALRVIALNGQRSVRHDDAASVEHTARAEAGAEAIGDDSAVAGEQTPTDQHVGRDEPAAHSQRPSKQRGAEHGGEREARRQNELRLRTGDRQGVDGRAGVQRDRARIAQGDVVIARDYVPFRILVAYRVVRHREPAIPGTLSVQAAALLQLKFPVAAVTSHSGLFC